MRDLTWQVGLIFVVIGACVLPYVFCLIADKMGSRDDWDTDGWDVTAEQKRRIEKRARNLSREFK